MLTLLLTPSVASPSHRLESVFVVLAVLAVSLVSLWYLVSIASMVVARLTGSHRIRRGVARWGAPLVKGIAATSLLTIIAAPAGAATDAIDLSWGAEATTSFTGATHTEQPISMPSRSVPLHHDQNAEPTTASLGQTLLGATHIVEPGDTLWSIARTHYPHAEDSHLPDLVIDLWLANKSTIGSNPDLIYPGQQLTLP